MYRLRSPPIVVAALLTAAVLAATPAALAGARTAVTTPVNVDISQRHLNESEEAIAVNPTNPDNIVAGTNVGQAEARLTGGGGGGGSFAGGETWMAKLSAPGAGRAL